MNAPEVVRRYAATLLNAAEESGVLEAVAGDIEGLAVTLEQSPELAAFLRDPLIDTEHKSGALDKLFRGKVQALTLNFLLLLAQRRRAGLLPDAVAAFGELNRERLGQVTAEVVSAVELNSGQRDLLQQRLSAYTGKDVVVEARVDASIKGGLVARVGDTVFDGSLANHLRNLHKRLAGN